MVLWSKLASLQRACWTRGGGPPAAPSDGEKHTPRKRDGNLVSLFRRAASADSLAPSASPSTQAGTPLAGQSTASSPGGPSPYNHRPPSEDVIENLRSLRRKIGGDAVEASVSRVLFATSKAAEALEKAKEALRGNAAEKEENAEKRAGAKAGALVDPDARRKGVTRDNQKGGRPKGSRRDPERACGSHKRELGGQVLKRDPTAQERLHIINQMELKCAEEGVGIDKVTLMSSSSKRAFEKRFGFDFSRLQGWAEKRPLYEEFVATMRVGVRGLRPFGSTTPTSYRSQGQGARLHEQCPKEPTSMQPLNAVLWSVKRWFEDEREHGNEVRGKHITQRTLTEIQLEQDKQLVLQNQESESYNESVHAACRVKLEFLRVHGAPSRQQERFMDRVVKPYIGATGRIGQHLVHEAVHLDRKKALLTYDSHDRGVWLVGKGSVEDLSLFVRDPEDFAKNRKETVYVTLDETGLWLKLRGEEKVFISERETVYNAQLKKLKQTVKNSRGQQSRQEALEHMRKFTEDPANENIKTQADAEYTTAGDKYRVTLVTISVVKNWWDPSKQVEPEKPKQVLIVPAAVHTRLKDMGRDEWKNEVRFERSDGTEFHAKPGDKIGKVMFAYRGARDNYEDTEWTDELEVMGQPKAWADKQMCVWISDFLAERYKQCMVSCDCLGARWSEPSVLRAFYNQQVMIPHAPDVTSFLQEPDTHEHNSIKAHIRTEKADLHHDLEAEAKNQGKSCPMDWGAYEFVWVVSRALKKFKGKNPLVPLKGLVENQLLILRQNSEGTFERIDEATEQTTMDIFEKMEITRVVTSSGLTQALVNERLERFEAWRDDQATGPPIPEWEWLHKKGGALVGDDLPQAPDEDIDTVFDIRFQDLDLSEHQKHMLKPVDERLKDSVYPKSVQSRVRSKTTSKRRNRWASKFKGHFVGKMAQKWSKRIKERGLKAGMQELTREAGPTAKVAQKPVAKSLAASLIKAAARTRREKQARKRARKEQGEDKGEKKRAKGDDKKGDDKKDKGDTVVENSPLKDKEVRVQGEAASVDLSGRAGTVAKVFLKGGVEYATVFETRNGGRSVVAFVAPSDVLVLEADCPKVQPISPVLDYRKLHTGRRVELGRQMLQHSEVGGELENIEKGKTVEFMTIQAAIFELEARFQDAKAAFTHVLVFSTVGSL